MQGYVMLRKKRTARGMKRKRGRYYVIYLIPVVVRELHGEATRQSQRLFKCTQQIYSHGKLSRDGILSP